MPLLILILGGGGYYALGVLWPARYAEALFVFEAELRAGALALSGPQKVTTLAEVQVHLSSLREFFRRMETQIRDLRPAPPRFRELQDDLEGAIAWLSTRSAESERGVQFLVGVKELAELIRRGFPSGVPSMTLGQFLTRYGPGLDQIRERADVLFHSELPTHPEVAELAVSWWGEARAALNAILADLRAQDPSLPAEPTLERLGASRAPEVKALDLFKGRIESMASTPLGSAIIPPLDTSSAPPDVQVRLARISQALENLRAQYPQYVPDGSR